MTHAYRVAVLASGGGSNLQALIDACGADGPATIALVLTNGEVGATTRARRAGIPAVLLEDPDDGPALLAALGDHAIDLVVLAGYLKLVPADVVAAYAGRMVNIHPALLPAFGGKGMYGLHVHRAVLDAGCTVTGSTVHLVTAEYDRGPILAQWPVAVEPDDTPETLRDRVLAVEHQLLPAVVLDAARAGKPVPVWPEAGAFGALRIRTR